MARAYRMILESDSKVDVFNVGCDVNIKLSKVLEYIISLSNEEIEVVKDPLRLRPIDNTIVGCDNTLLRTVTGWKPRFTIFETLNEMYNWYLENNVGEG
ncbi:MAG: hypothetical protein ACLRZZ_07955 [Enterocloster sp.]